MRSCVVARARIPPFPEARPGALATSGQKEETPILRAPHRKHGVPYHGVMEDTGRGVSELERTWTGRRIVMMKDVASLKHVMSAERSSVDAVGEDQLGGIRVDCADQCEDAEFP